MSQAARVLEYLRRYGAISPLDALREIGSMRLAARIQELREAGHQITTHMVLYNGKRFAMYTLEKKHDTDSPSD